jgi:hypothetical protein
MSHATAFLIVVKLLTRHLPRGYLRQLNRACRTGGRSRIGKLVGGRKVRSPQGSMPANGRGGSLKADFTESATENIPPEMGRKLDFR